MAVARPVGRGRRIGCAVPPQDRLSAAVLQPSLATGERMGNRWPLLVGHSRMWPDLIQQERLLIKRAGQRPCPCGWRVLGSNQRRLSRRFYSPLSAKRYRYLLYLIL